MMSISNVMNPDYLVKHSQHGYLSENDSEKGMFLGRGSILKKRYGNEVDKEGFYDLINFKPEDRIKRKNKDEKNKNHGTELVFSAPKDWSILINLVDDETRLRMQNAWQEMVKVTAKTIEENTFYRKKVKGKVIYESAKAVEMAAFNHHTARTIDDRPDMQEHVHITIGPKVLGQDGKYYSHTLKDLVKEKSGDNNKKQATLHYFDQVAQQHLAKFLQKELGLNVTRGINDSFQIEGITKEQREFFSKRSEQVKDELGKNSTPEQRQKAITQKRNKKDDYDLRELRGVWQEEYKKLGMSSKELKRGQREQARQFKDVFKDIKFIDEKQLKIYALSESKYSNKSYERLLEEYKSDSSLKMFAKDKYINLNHSEMKNFKNNYDRGLIDKFQKSQNASKNTTVKASKGNKTSISTIESKLKELESQHQARIVELTSSTNSFGNKTMSKLSSENASYEQRRSQLLQELIECEEEKSSGINLSF